jgi:hypothetical protein
MKTNNLGIPTPNKLTREAALELLVKGCETYLVENRALGTSPKGAILELRYIVSPKGMGAIIDWFLSDATGGDADDLVTLLLTSWSEPLEADLDWAADLSKDWED